MLLFIRDLSWEQLDIKPSPHYVPVNALSDEIWTMFRGTPTVSILSLHGTKEGSALYLHVLEGLVRNYHCWGGRVGPIWTLAIKSMAWLHFSAEIITCSLAARVQGLHTRVIVGRLSLRQQSSPFQLPLSKTFSNCWQGSRMLDSTSMGVELGWTPVGGVMIGSDACTTSPETGSVARTLQPHPSNSRECGL